MKVCHWTLKNGSGMGNFTAELSDAEKVLGIDSVYVDVLNTSEWPLGLDADINIVHASLPDQLKRKKPAIFVAHGVPEHCFTQSVQDGMNAHGNTHSGVDSWSMSMYYCQEADKFITFWPRHKEIWQQFRKGDEVICLPMGINTDFWKSVPSVGALVGTPSVFYGENSHPIKWPLEILLLWNKISDVIPTAKLTVAHLPMNQMRWWSSVLYSASLSPSVFFSTGSFDSAGVRLIASDPNVYQLGLVKYGDFNKLSLEAAACGNKTISFAGNPYASFWLSEGNQEQMVKELISIFNGEVTPRIPSTVVSISETAKEMVKIYGKL